ncbi:hypothetical protein ACKEVG_07625, partial [Yersinia enterocolitica]
PLIECIKRTLNVKLIYVKPKYKWILIRQWNRVLNLAWIKAPLSHKLNMVICHQIILLKYNPFFI